MSPFENFDGAAARKISPPQPIEDAAFLHQQPANHNDSDGDRISEVRLRVPRTEVREEETPVSVEVPPESLVRDERSVARGRQETPGRVEPSPDPLVRNEKGEIVALRASEPLISLTEAHKFLAARYDALGGEVEFLRSVGPAMGERAKALRKLEDEVSQLRRFSEVVERFDEGPDQHILIDNPFYQTEPEALSDEDLIEVEEKPNLEKMEKKLSELQQRRADLLLAYQKSINAGVSKEWEVGAKQFRAAQFEQPAQWPDIFPPRNEKEVEREKLLQEAAILMEEVRAEKKQERVHVSDFYPNWKAKVLRSAAEQIPGTEPIYPNLFPSNVEGVNRKAELLKYAEIEEAKVRKWENVSELLREILDELDEVNEAIAPLQTNVEFLRKQQAAEKGA